MSTAKIIQETFPEEYRDFLMNFFLNCPLEVYEQISIREYPKHYNLISTFEETRYVFLLLKGKLQAIEERVVLIPYQFTEIEPIDIVGDYEVFTQMQGHYVTLTTLEPSLCLQLPAQTYENWLRKDANALFIRTQMFMQVLAKQTQQQRQFLFMDTTHRLLYYLYEKSKQPKLVFPFKIEGSRESISAHIGCSVRQLNRILNKLKKETTLNIHRGKILLTKKQLHHIEQEIEDYL